MALSSASSHTPSVLDVNGRATSHHQPATADIVPPRASGERAGMGPHTEGWWEGLGNDSNVHTPEVQSATEDNGN